MTDRPLPTIDSLRAELEAAFRNRGDLYRLMLAELDREVGPERAEEMMTRIVEQRGREVAHAAFASFESAQAVEIGEAFLAASPDGGRMYPVEVEREKASIAFQVLRCPLKDAWNDAGLDATQVARLCRVAGAFDRGLFEATGISFENRTWRPGDGAGCCWIRLSVPEVNDLPR